MAERPDPQPAFRAGVLGWGFAQATKAPAFTAESYAFGANELVAVRTGRLPGLTAPRDAYECGRALRAICKLLDRAGAPPSVGRQFTDNLTAACVAHLARRSDEPWGAQDTVDMFMELYARVLHPGPSEYSAIRGAILAYSQNEAVPLPGTAPSVRTHS